MVNVMDDVELVPVGWSKEQVDCRLMFEQNAQPMWVFGPRGIVAVNQAALSHYGYSREEFLALSRDDLEASSDPEEDPAPPALVPPPEDRARLVGRHQKKDRTAIDVEISSFEITFGGT